MSGEAIIFDIDDVLRPSTYRLSGIFAERHGISFEHPAYMKDNTLYGMFTLMKEATGLPEAEIVDEVEDILVSPEFNNFEPIEGSIEVVSRVAEKNRAYAVSSTPACTAETTLNWLDKFFQDRFKEVRILGGRWGHGPRVDKIASYRELGATHIVDDLVGHATAAKLVGAKAILFGLYPWNDVSELEPHVTRCSDWPAVNEYFDAI